MLIEEIEFKDFIINYYYNNNEIELRGIDNLRNMIKIKCNKTNKFIYKVNIDIIYKELELNTREEEDEDFKELVKYFYSQYDCNLFIIQRSKINKC